MQRVHQIAALLFILLSGLVIWESTSLEYYSKLGPGAGFFPIWLAAVLGVLSLVWLIQVSRLSGRPKDGAFLPELSGIVRILSILASMIITAALMDILGFQLTMFLFSLFLLRVLGRQELWVSLITAIICSVGLFHVFRSYLDVPLPLAAVEILANLGL